MHTNREREGEKELTFVRFEVVCDVVDAVRKTVKLEELTFSSTILTDPSPELEFRLGVLPKKQTDKYAAL